MTPAEAHIAAQERLRRLAVEALRRVWRALGRYDRDNVDDWLTVVLPVVLASQYQSVALTEGYLARALERQPIGVDTALLVGAAVRGGAAPAEVYRRPFVTVWTALSNGTPYEDAIVQGLDRATSAAATDVQLTMRSTLREVGEADPAIVGYRRVPDGGACAFCRVVAGQRYRTDQLMPIHSHCGCGVDIITPADRGDFTGKRENDLSVPGAAVHEHGELGPVLADPAHNFTFL